jgi:hypothetical protein
MGTPRPTGRGAFDFSGVLTAPGCRSLAAGRAPFESHGAESIWRYPLLKQRLKGADTLRDDLAEV